MIPPLLRSTLPAASSNSPSGKAPFLFAEHHESASAPTVLIYGHGDVVDGMEGEWRDGRDPWRTTVAGTRLMAVAPPTTRASTASTWHTSVARPAPNRDN